MKSNVDAALAYVFKDEGGYAERKVEGGGAVNKGITFKVFKTWRLLKGMPEPTWKDLELMETAEATEIYQEQYLKGVHFDDIPAGPDYCVLDASITGGVGGSIKLLQGVLGLERDGHYGLVTRWAVQHRPVVAMIDALCNARLEKYKTFHTFNEIANPDRPPEKQKTWGRIWTDRIEVVRKRSKAMVPREAAKPAPVVVAPVVIIPGDSSFPPAISPMPNSTAISRGMIKRGGTVEQFLRYLHDEVKPQMGSFNPSMIVLHNTDKPRQSNWPGRVEHSDGTVEILTPQKRLDNMSVSWTASHFSAAPHLMLPPDGLVWALWPLWKIGTHSPKWNKISWGIETVGNFDLEIPTPALLHTLPIVGAGLCKLGGIKPDKDTIKLHKQDPITTHTNCPGVNLGTQEFWIEAFNEQLHAMNAMA